MTRYFFTIYTVELSRQIESFLVLSVYEQAFFGTSSLISFIHIILRSKLKKQLTLVVFE